MSNLDDETDSTPAMPGRGAGRPKGSKNRRTEEVEKWLKPLLPKAKKRLTALIESKDDSVSLKASSLVVSYIYGKPIARQELTGADGAGLMYPSRIDRLIVDPKPRNADGSMAVEGDDKPKIAEGGTPRDEAGG